MFVGSRCGSERSRRSRRVPRVQSVQGCFLLAFGRHFLDGKRLARNPTVAEMSTRNFVLSRTFFVRSRRLDQGCVLHLDFKYTRGLNESVQYCSYQNRAVAAALSPYRTNQRGLAQLSLVASFQRSPLAHATRHQHRRKIVGGIENCWHSLRS